MLLSGAGLPGNPGDLPGEGGVAAGVEEPAAGGHHLLAVTGKPGMHPVGGQQVDVSLGGKIKAVPQLAAQRIPPPVQRPPADRATEKWFAVVHRIRSREQPKLPSISPSAK